LRISSEEVEVDSEEADDPESEDTSSSVGEVGVVQAILDSYGQNQIG